ncbi:hypothetical protein D3C80_1013380 [compost metagenome]
MLDIATVPGFNGQLSAAAITRQHRVQLRFRQGEGHGDRLGLGDDHQGGGVVGRHQVADVKLAQAQAAVDRRADTGEVEVELGVTHRRLVGLDRALVLADQCFLGVQRLLGDAVFGVQAFITLQVDLGVFQLRLVLRQRAFGLLQGDLVSARVDLGQQITGLDLLPFLEIDLDQLAAHPAAHIHRVGRGHRTQGLEVHREITHRRRFDPYRHRPTERAKARPSALAAWRSAGLLRGRRRPQPPAQAGDQQQDQQADKPATRGTGTRKHRLIDHWTGKNSFEEAER